MVTKNPVSRVKLLTEDNDRMRVLGYKEQQKYPEAASGPRREMAIILVETGMRPEEVYRIKRDDVHLDDRYVFNPHGKTKEARRRVPALHRFLSSLLLHLSR